jgi:hypothetical protein
VAEEKKMKTKLLIILSVLIIAVAVTGPVTAGPTDATAITGNPVAYISVAVNTTGTEIALVTDSQNVNDTLQVNVTANPIGWRLSVTDLMDGGKTHVGHMVNWTGSAWATPDTYLISPLFIQGSNVPAVATQGAEVNLNTGGTLETGIAATPSAGTWFIMTTRQPVEINDRSLANPNVYRLVLLFTGTVT